MTQTAISSNLRSTAAITAYVVCCDRLAALAAELKALQREEKELRPDVLQQIGDGRAVKVSGIVRKLAPVAIVSVSRIVDDETAAAACQAAGLDVDHRSSVWVSPSKLRAYAIAGDLPAGIAEVAETLTVKIS